MAAHTNIYLVNHIIQIKIHLAVVRKPCECYKTFYQIWTTKNLKENGFAKCCNGKWISFVKC